MSQRRLVIHAGFHKSGTTAIQEALNAQSQELREAGIIYPDIGRKAHHRIAWALSGKAWGWGNRGGRKTSSRHWNSLANSINSSNAETILLSSEFFSELDSQAISKIFSKIKGRRVEALFTVRPLVKLLGSSYQQYLKYGITADYEEWLHSVLDKPGESKINPTFWQRHFHGQVVERWAKILGPDSVSVIIVDETKPQFLFDSINSHLGLPNNFLKPVEIGSNRSLTMEEIALLLEINRRFPKERNWSEYEVFIRRGYIQTLTDTVAPSPNSERLLTPSWAIKKGNEIGAEIKRELIAIGAKIIGNIESLDSAQVPEGDAIYPKNISIEVISQAMLSFDKSSISRFPIKWVQGDLINRYKNKLTREISLRRKKL
jgi:hypothetical protein